MNLERWTLALIVALLAVGCSTLPFDEAGEGRKLLERDAQWARLSEQGTDVDRIMSYFGDGAVMIPPGQPAVEGKVAIRDFVVSSLRIPGFRIHWVSDRVTFSPDGKLAYMHGRNETTMRDPSGTLVTFPGRGVTIWRLDPDGQWRCVVDIWNDPPKAQT